MNKEIFELLKQYIDFRIMELIEDDHHRDSGPEYLKRYEAEKELEKALGL